MRTPPVPEPPLAQTLDELAASRASRLAELIARFDRLEATIDECRGIVRQHTAALSRRSDEGT